MYRATGSNRRMVRPSSMLAVKLLIIRVRSMQQILGLALFIRQEVLWNSPPEILKLSMVIVLSQVLNSNLVPNCIRSNLRGSKFKIFLGGGATIILLPSCPPPPIQNPVWNLATYHDLSTWTILLWSSSTPMSILSAICHLLEQHYS